MTLAMELRLEWCDCFAAEPLGDGDRIEPQQVSPLHERDASLGHQSTNVPHRYVEMRRDRSDVDEARDVRTACGRGLHASRSALLRFLSRSSYHGHNCQLLDRRSVVLKPEPRTPPRPERVRVPR